MTAYPVIEESATSTARWWASAVLIALLVDQQYDEFEKIYKLNKAIRPACLALEEIEITDAQWEECMERAFPDHVRCGPLSLQSDAGDAG